MVQDIIIITCMCVSFVMQAESEGDEDDEEKLSNNYTPIFFFGCINF